MELAHYVMLSAKMLHLPNIQHDCHRNVSKNTSLVLNEVSNEDGNSYFTMVGTN